MSDFERKHAAAMKELEATGIWRSNYAPPIYHLYRALGLKVRPPHYAGLLAGILGQGVFFGVVWGLFMWWSQWRGTDLPVQGMLLSAVFAGALFGGVMAVAYAYGRRKWKLTAWDDL